jgi:hypothetical protein
MEPKRDLRPRSPDTPVDPANKHEIRQQMLSFFCNHFVSLVGSYVIMDDVGREIGEEQFFAFSGFVLSVRGTWCLVTAGHSIEDLETGLKNGSTRLTRCCLVDYLGDKPKVSEPTPFDYEGAQRHCIHRPDLGLDFALVGLRPFFQMSLEANGIRAISEENWVRQDASRCELFALLGLPKCLVEDSKRLVPFGDRVAGIVNPILVPVFPVQLHPEEMPTTDFPWFVGEVGAASVLPDLDGMSGGPIFGFAQSAKGEWHYWIVAVQSRWREDRRILYGCPVPVCASIAEEALLLSVSDPR